MNGKHAAATTGTHTKHIRKGLILGNSNNVLSALCLLFAPRDTAIRRLCIRLPLSAKTTFLREYPGYGYGGCIDSLVAEEFSRLQGERVGGHASVNHAH